MCMLEERKKKREDEGTPNGAEEPTTQEAESTSPTEEDGGLSVLFSFACFSLSFIGRVGCFSSRLTCIADSPE